MAIVCEKMGWTFDQYLSQPTWFINLLLAKFSADTKNAEMMRKRYGNNRNT